MKKVLTALALLAASTFATAEIQVAQLPIYCGKASVAFDVLKNYKEQSVFVGLDTSHNVENLTISVFHNPETKSFSVLFLSPDKDMACILSAGESSKMMYNN